QLISIIQTILNKNVMHDIEKQKHEAYVTGLKATMTSQATLEQAIRSVLFKLYHVGSAFVNWDTEIDYLSLPDVQRRMEINPTDMPIEPSSTGRVRAKCRDLLLDIQGKLEELGDHQVMFQRLRLIRFWDELTDEEDFNSAVVKLNIDFTNDAYTIGEFVDIMHVMAKFNLEQVLRIGGIWFMTTANFYFETFFGITMNTIELNFESTSYSYEIFAGRSEQ
ncbi:MAG: hypothetical protein ACMG6E_08630, partial [Candidatus Roizmanbacteria bacterium]